MTFVFFTSPPPSGRSLAFKQLDDEQRFWVRVLSAYEANLRKDMDEISSEVYYQHIRLRALAYLALAFDQRGWMVERRQVTFKMAAAGKYSVIGMEGGNNQSYGKSKAGSIPERGQAGVEEYLGGTLAEALGNVDAEQWHGYCVFEQLLLNKVCGVIEGESSFTRRLAEINTFCETIRKMADDTDRTNLRLLQTCADTALADIYAFASSALFSELEAMVTNGSLHAKLTPEDIAVNRCLHSPREDLGGLVLALHPVGSILLDSGAAIKALRTYTLNPEDSDAKGRFHAMLLAAAHTYRNMIDELVSRKTVTEEFYRNPVKPDKPTPIDLAQSASRVSPAVLAECDEKLDWVLHTLEHDMTLERNKAVFWDRVFNQLSVSEVANKYNISVGEVTKRTQAVQNRLRALSQAQGF